MTGIEMLRNLARHCRDASVNGCTTVVTSVHAAAIEAIADQLEREMQPKCDPAEDVSMSAYGLLPEEDRDAIAWVRDHGGLERVNRERECLYGVLRETCYRLDVEYFGVWTTDAQSIWRETDKLKRLLGESVPRAACDRHIARRQRQIDESHAALRRRNARVAELEREVKHQQDVGAVHLERIGELVDENKELRARVENQRASLEGLTAAIGELRTRLMPEGMEWLVESWPRFEDDAPVCIGDEISWRDEGGVVNSIELQDGGYFILHAADSAEDWILPQYFPGERVKRPAPKVYDADGVEIREGETPYRVDNGKQVEIRRIDTSYGESCVFVGVDGMSCGYWLRPDQLTHERPDSWERLEEDANVAVCAYFGTSVKDCESCDHNSWECSYDKARDLVRRAKKLAERDR